MIWFAMAIPILTSLFLYLKYHHRVLWWEFVIPFSVSALLILFFKLGTEFLQTTDTEYWGGWVTNAEYFEDWDERVPCRHPKYKTVTRTRADGSSYTEEVFDGYQHPYDVDYHPPYWQVHDSNELTIQIDKNKFEELARKFNNKKFVDLHRNYHSNDGDKYVAFWQWTDDTLESVVTTHHYENRVQASDSVFRFRKVDPKKYGLFDYPKINGFYNCPSVLSKEVVTQEEAIKKLDIWNAKLGKKKQVRIWILVFLESPVEAGFEQEQFWKGGNKNEFVVTIGVDKNYKVNWCYPFSWTEAEILKVDTRDFVINQKEFNLVKIVDWLGPQIEEKFVRKQFADFSYLSVEPPWWAVLITYLATFGVNIGLSWWIVKNEYHE